MIIARSALVALSSMLCCPGAFAQRHEPLTPVMKHQDDVIRWRCADIAVSVQSASSADAQRVCTAAKISADVLSTCGLSLRRLIDVEVTDKVYLLSGESKWGEFLSGASRVRVLSSAMHQELARSAFDKTKVPLEEHYSSIVAHEIAHAIFYDHTVGLDLPQTAHEYVAYILQMKAFSVETLKHILDREQRIYTSNLFVFSHFLMFADPDRYGVIAYIHFTHPDNGCEFLKNVMLGKVHFPPPSD